MMTTPTPVETYFEYEAWLFTDDWEELDVSSITPSMDVDRLTVCEATMVLASVTDEQWAALDPRNQGLGFQRVSFTVRQYDMTGTQIGQVPPVGLPGENRADLWIRTVRRNIIGGEVTVTLAGGESILNERRRNSGGSIDTAATYVGGLVLYSLYDTFGGAVTSFDSIVNTTNIPAGDRRMFNPGETHLDLLRPELDAIGCRLVDFWGKRWIAGTRDSSGLIKLGTYTQDDGLPADVDGIVSEASEVVTRDGDWADGVLVKYDNTDNGGAVTWSISGGGTNTKGLFLTFERAAPGAGAAPANAIAARALTRGHDYDIEAACSLDVVAGTDLELWTRAGTTTGLTIRAVEWRPHEGTMTIRAQTGDPI